MSVNWQNKILHLEIPPPTEVWEKIANQLDKEFDAGEVMISQKLGDYEMEPPAFILGNVLDKVNSDTPNVPARKIFTITSRRIAIAAAMIGLISISLIYLIRPGGSSKTKNAAASIVPVAPGSTSPSAPGNNNSTNQPSSLPDLGIASLNAHLIKSLFMQVRTAKEMPGLQNTQN